MGKLFYREERDRDFFEACEQVRAREGFSSVFATVSQAIHRPARSFYIHPRGYSSIIRENGKRLPRNKIKKALHLDILHRYRELKKENPGSSVSQIIGMIESQSAPRFYISERRAEDIYYALLKKPRSRPHA